MADATAWSRKKVLTWSFCALMAMVALIALMPSSAVAARNCTANDNLDEVAEDFMARCTKGDIQRVFPGELRGATLGELKRGSTAAHKRGWKLVNRKIYLKSSVAPAVSPSDQTINGWSGTATWSVTVDQDPQYEETLVFDFGDGGKRNAGCAAGQRHGDASVLQGV